MTDRPINATTGPLFDREARTSLAANEAFADRQQAEGLRRGASHQPIAGGDMNLQMHRSAP
jgi:hypothetical protein